MAEHDSPTSGGEAAPQVAARRLRYERGAAVGPYVILEAIGEGGFGTVYLAEQREPVRRRVALKVVKPGMDSAEVIGRFEAERQALAVLDHPGVAKVLDAGATADGRPYFVMEYVPGVPITRYCDEHRLTMPERLALFIRVCQAVQHAHHKGIIHRDLKPGNVLVSTVDGKPAPKVIDFGIAKAMGRRLSESTVYTEAGRLMGTLEYMSPEQASGGVDLDTRTDIYALGVVLYELLAGALPFESASLRKAGHEAMQRIIGEVEPPKPSTRLLDSKDAAGDIARHRSTDVTGLRRQLRGDLDWITMKALEKDRARRYDSPSALALDLERHLRNEPVIAGPPSAAYKARKFLRRHRAAAAAAAMIVALLVVGLGVSATLWRRAERARGAAVREAAKARAAYTFVSDMFGAIDPATAKGREVTVREVLDAAAARAGTTLQGEPEVEGTVRRALGGAYYHIGRYAPAETNQRASLAALERGLGPDHPETLSAVHELAASVLSQDRADEAVTLSRRAVEGRTRALGPRHKDTLASRSFLAYALQVSGDLAGAEKLIREVVADQTAALGARSRDTIESRCSLADVLQDLGRFEEAVGVSAALVLDAGGALGEDDTLTIQAKSIHASILGSLGRESDAEPVIRGVVAAKRRIFGAAHRDTLISEGVLADTLKSLGKLDEVEQIQRSILERATTALGADHATTLTYENNLAQTLRAQKKLDEAEPLYRHVLERTKAAQGPTARETLISLVNLAMLLRDRKRPEEALPLLEEALHGLEATMPPGHWMIGASHGYLGECLAEMGRFEQAETEGLAAHTALSSALGPTHVRTRTAAKGLAKIYTLWGRSEKATEWEGKAAPPASPARPPGAGL